MHLFMVIMQLKLITGILDPVYRFYSKKCITYFKLVKINDELQKGCRYKLGLPFCLSQTLQLRTSVSPRVTRIDSITRVARREGYNMLF